MKCSIRGEVLVVRGVFSARFRASSSDLTEVRIMTEPDYIGPFAGLRKLLFGNTVRLRFVMLRTEDEEISLDVRRDRGVAGAISWLREIGWDIDSAIEEGTETPLVRVSAMKLQGY